MAAWPASLPQAPLLGTSSIAPQDVIGSQGVGLGPATNRERTTSAGEIVSMSFGMTSAQLTTFDTFWITTLSGGSAEFDIPHPIDGTTQTAVFLDVPVTSDIAGDFFKVAVKLHMLA